MTNRQGVFPLTKSLDDSIKKGVTTRNNIVHLGCQAPSMESTDNILSAVQDVLWILDYCCGHDWAFNYISIDAIRQIQSKIKKKG